MELHGNGRFNGAQRGNISAVSRHIQYGAISDGNGEILRSQHPGVGNNECQQIRINADLNDADVYRSYKSIGVLC